LHMEAQELISRVTQLTSAHLSTAEIKSWVRLKV
jgi:hypothetical protein